MITLEYKHEGMMLILDSSDKNNRLLEFGKNREGIETMLSYTAGFAKLHPVSFIVYRDIEKNHINVKKGPACYTNEFKKFILDYGIDFEPITSRFEILDL